MRFMVFMQVQFRATYKIINMISMECAVCVCVITVYQLGLPPTENIYS